MTLQVQALTQTIGDLRVENKRLAGVASSLSENLRVQGTKVAVCNRAHGCRANLPSLSRLLSLNRLL